MAEILLYVIIIIGSIIMGAFFMMIGYLVFDWFFNVLRKRRVPKDNGPLGLANPGKPEIDEKEVIEDDRRKAEKFREFEKLRRIGDRESGTKRTTGITTSGTSDVDQLRESELFTYGARREPQDDQPSTKPSPGRSKKTKRVTF